MRTLIASTLFLGLVALADSAAAEEPEGSKRAHVGVHAGVVLPQLGSELGTTFGGRLEASLQIWRQLAPFVAAGYSQPVVETSGADARLPAGDVATTTTQRELTVTLGILWRLKPLSSPLNAFFGGGLRAYFLETLTEGSAGDEEFLENRETSTRYGGVGLLGGELRLGPGALTLTVEAGGSDLPHVITGDVATTAVGVDVGYRLFF